MTEDQFNKFMAVQTAQLAMLQSISNAAQAIAVKGAPAGGPKWNEVEASIKNAQAIIVKI